jgi:hypothetical protein
MECYVCSYSISWTDSHSSSCTLPSVCGADGSFALLLAGFPSLIFLRIYVYIYLSLFGAGLSLNRQSWTIHAIIYPFSSVIVYSSDVLWAFDFLHAASHLCGWPLVFPYCLWVGPCFSLLRGLHLLLLLHGQLFIILLSILGPCLRWPFFCLYCFSMARSSSLGHLDFFWLGFF